MKGQQQLFSHAGDEWTTPQWLFDQLDSIYHFTLDPAANPINAKCAEYYTKADNGLERTWKDHRVFLNPPYSEIEVWMSKAAEEWRTNNVLVVALVPNRSCTKWYHDHVHDMARVDPIKGRLKFENGKATNSAPFPSIVCTYFPRLVAPRVSRRVQGNLSLIPALICL